MTIFQLPSLRARVKRAFLALVAGCSLALATGCETMGEMNPDALGTLIGGSTGALVGSQVGGGSGRLVATGVGTIAGALIGREIAQHLSRSGQHEMANANQRALETGRSQSWEDPETGARGQTEVTQRSTQRSQVPVSVKRDRVDEMPPIDLIGSSYRATASSNVRGGPGTDYRSVGSLAAGQNVHVVGKVEGRDWYLIAEEGAADGFVATRLLTPAPQAPQRPPATGGEGEVMLVQAERTCSVNTTRVTEPDGSVAEDRIRICEGPDGYVIEEA